MYPPKARNSLYYEILKKSQPKLADKLWLKRGLPVIISKRDSIKITKWALKIIHGQPRIR